MWHEILHAVLDSLYLLPFLFVCYILIELIESWTSKSSVSLFGKNGVQVLIGASAGLIPQCGFGVLATDLYTKRKISMGTLLAIYIATSDEAFPLILSTPEKAGSLIPLLLIKFVVALLVGYIVYGIERHIIKKSMNNNHEKHNNDDHEHNQNQADSQAQEHDHDHEHTQVHLEGTSEKIHIGCCGHEIEETDDEQASTKKRLKRYLLHPLKHTLYIFTFILAVNIAFGLLLHFIGEESIESFLNQTKAFTPLLAVLVGLIPNCASSVILTNMYILGSLPFGALLSGLIVNAGISITVLIKQNKPLKNTLLILAILIITALATGFATLWLF